jgi:hypothetical protein
MILLITPATRAQDCAKAIEEATGEPVQVAATLQQAISHLRAAEYLAVVIDQSLVEGAPDESERVLQHIEMATPVFVNFAISGIERVVRELRSALQRRTKEVLIARKVAEGGLRNELKGTVTAILLSCEMALQTAGLLPAAQVKLQAIDELVREMRKKLGMAAGA